jgi:3-deoxy-manno-octulosonate cytidylyltransferase (CMP-KDO synthetase)
MHGDNIVVIPARLESTRLPKKLLLKESGKYLLQHVYERVSLSKKADMVLIATDSLEIMEICKEFCASAILTSEKHQSGTDRVQEAVKDFYFQNIINVQGDEPFINPAHIDLLIERLESTPVQFVTLATRITADDVDNRNAVKVYIDNDSSAVDFGRSMSVTMATKHKVFKHVGVYGYKKDALKTFTGLKQTEREASEKLEQLRLIDNGFKIGVIPVTGELLGIDTREDYDRFLTKLKEKSNDA